MAFHSSSSSSTSAVHIGDLTAHQSNRFKVSKCTVAAFAVFVKQRATRFLSVGLLNTPQYLLAAVLLVLMLLVSLTTKQATSVMDVATTWVIVLVSIFSFAFAMYWWYVNSAITMLSADRDKFSVPYEGSNNSNSAEGNTAAGGGDYPLSPRAPAGPEPALTDEMIHRIELISRRVSEGANAFLFAQYRSIALFLVLFGGFLWVLLGWSQSQDRKVSQPWVVATLSVFSLLLGAATSVGAGFLGMRIAVYTNSRTAIMATEGRSENDSAVGFRHAFETAFRGGITMGFSLTALGLFSLFFTIKLMSLYFGSLPSHAAHLYECVAAFGLGGSAVACFGRVGGGIFTKAADVGSDLVGKVEANIPEDDARNPGVIADCIGDNVGDIAGMGSDLFGSFAEATCAALVIAATSADLTQSFTAMMYPLLISAVGLLVCMGTALAAASNAPVRRADDVEPVLKRQLIYSTIAATVALSFLTLTALPATFLIHQTVVTPWRALVCVLCGLWTGLFIGFTTEYYTSNTYRPVQEVAEACEVGAATNIIYGLSLGYHSVVPPTFVIALTIYVSYVMANVYGYALAALGILATMCIGLTIDAYGPIADNAGGFAEMAHMGPEIREVTDALDAAGNTTAAIGKGFAIASAAFVGLALYAAYVSRVAIVVVDIVDARVFPGLLLGAMLPYWFSAMTMKSVGIAAIDMVNEIRRQFQDPAVASGDKEPNYNACVAIATKAALREMRPPAALVMIFPILTGLLFGKYALAGLLPGAIISGVQLAISSSNTGGAWDNAKKYVEKGGLVIKGRRCGKGSPEHAAAVIGDTVGDPLKDTSGPSLNILIKLMAIISLVCAPMVESKVGGFALAWFE